ncbi:MAG: phosphatidylserine decarboxylase [Campylobacterota bacterium]|nr:phosphatidylserine decarboxylase [Campylobacterota bacterium]
MKGSNLLPIAKEGLFCISSALALFLFFILIDLEFLAFLAFASSMVLVYFFRNPERELPMFESSSVISPCDGVVKSIVELEDSEYAYRVDIESNLSDIAILRAPISAKVQELEKFNGTRVAKKSKLFLDTNERGSLVFKGDNANSVKVTHRLKESFAPLFMDVKKAVSLQQSARYGFMLNGVTSLYLPHNFRLNVSVSDELKASESLMGYFS